MSEDAAARIEKDALHRMLAIQKVELLGDSAIQRYMEDATFLITGGTGFIGKQLIEKLLRSCPGIKKVYMLVRPKKGKTIQERLEEQFQDPLYYKLREVYPSFNEKIIAVDGDVTQIKVGINHKVWQRIKHEINYIIHTAATVRFDESLKTVIITNVRGTREMTSLAMECPNLKSFVYISTAYAHCNRTEVKEEFYESPLDPEVAIKMVESLGDDKINEITESLIKGWPNTYTFSKALSEKIVKKASSSLPICVIRPPIVCPTYSEPMPGWLDTSNIYGPSSAILGPGIGVIHVMRVHTDTPFDIVPLDFVNNLIIVSAYETARERRSEATIYSLSRQRNPAYWRDAQVFLDSEARNLVTPMAIWYCFCFCVANKFLFLVLCIFLHFIPALMIDILLAMIGNKIRLTSIYLKAFKINSVVFYFMSKCWKFHDNNTIELFDRLSTKDKIIFNFDVTTIDLIEHLKVWCIGLRKYIIKDGLKNTDYAIKRQFWFKIANYVFVVLYGLLLWYFFVWYYGVVSKFVSIFFM